jgi:hypothetical protein
MWVWNWVVQNKQWVFDGFGIALFGVLWWIIKRFWPKHEAAAIAPVTAQASIAPSIVMNPTINIDSRPPEPAQVVSPAPVATISKPKPNLCVEAIKAARIYLQADIWCLRPNPVGWDRPKPYRALIADISNVPTDEAHTAKAATRAAIRMEVGGRPRTYSPLPWLDEFTNLVYVETGARKTVVLAVGEDSKTGAWTFVLNNRKDYTGSGVITEMDWTNQCPIPSDLPFELLMIDMNSGAILAKFKFLWTFDAENNWPVLKSVD